MMMRRNTIAFLLVMLVCMTGVLWVAPHLFSSVQAQDVQRLVLRDSSGRELFSRPAPDGSEFAIRYRHSVALSPVEDWFSVSGGCIYLEKTVYQDFGRDRLLPLFIKAEEDRLLTKKEVAAQLGICETSVWNMTKRGKLTAVNVNSSVRYRQSEVSAILNAKASNQ